MEDYLPILHAFNGTGVLFAAIGTWALKLYHPEEMRSYVLHDCDIVLAPDLENINLAIHTLKQMGWEVLVWGQEIGTTATQEFLMGKYYLRATKEALVLDLVHECPLIDWKTMEKATEFKLGIPVASLEHIMILKRQKILEQGGDLGINPA